ncbi:MAG: hypothetical protein NT066_07440, partial [Candidatus Omnitrophica bacterium]|nr:hypothetical protein [Candidatus Omnitrophota bacterium]
MNIKRWSLPLKVEKLLLKKDKKGVLYLLSRITALNTKTFIKHDTEYLRYVGQFRIQMLIDWKMYREALAWVCLECELYPQNLEAQILKESLKARIYNIPREQEKNTVVLKPWYDVAGMYELKATIESDIIRPLQEWKLYEKFGVSIPNGFLFYGPPGCGKTFFGRKIAER